MAETPQTRYTRTDDGLAIAYQTFGSGPTDVVLLPANPCVDQMWDEPSYAHGLRRLAEPGRLISLDYRGHGASDPVSLDALPTAETWMEDTRVVMDAAGSSAAHIVCHGVSFLGVLFAASHPDRTKSLILVDPTARALEADDYPCGVRREVLAQFLEWDARTYGTPEHVRMYAPSRAHDEAFIRWQGRMERAGNHPSVHAALARWLTELDIRAVLPSVHVPTLVIARHNLFAGSLDAARYVADHIPGARFVEFRGRDVWLFSEDADGLADQMLEFITGSRPVRADDRALATVVFTDLVRSTETAAQLGDRQWRELLDRHDEMVESQLVRFRGRLVKTTGDGVLATFDGPGRAVRCAEAIRDDLRALGLTVRAGLHTGEVELRGEDVGGIAVHIAQRISGLAGPEEILVSSTVRDLVIGSDIEFEDRGDHGLKGVPGTWRLLAVRA